MKRWKMVIARTKAGMTQLELAERFGKTQAWVARVEGCKINPTVEDAADMESLFGLEPGYFELTNTKKQCLRSAVKNG